MGFLFIFHCVHLSLTSPISPAFFSLMLPLDLEWPVSALFCCCLHPSLALVISGLQSPSLVSSPSSSFVLSWAHGFNSYRLGPSIKQNL